jgi:hypothetical protein
MISVGVPDEILRDIGLVMVMAAQLDHRRMTLLHKVADIPVEESAAYRRSSDLTKAIKEQFSVDPLMLMKPRVDAWLGEVTTAFEIRNRYAHSITYFEARGDGTSGSYIRHLRSSEAQPVVDATALQADIERIHRAGSVGVRLELDAMVLRQGGADAYYARLREYDRLEAQMAKAVEWPAPEDEQ